MPNFLPANGIGGGISPCLEDAVCCWSTLWRSFLSFSFSFSLLFHCFIACATRPKAAMTVVFLFQTEFKPRKAACRTLTQDEEDDLVTWLTENTFIYNKSSAEFKFKEKTNRTSAAKEAELSLNPGDLSSIWYPNTMTQFSKLIKVSTKSGSGAAPERTARQQWILDRFAFLCPYLVQLRQQHGSTVSNYKTYRIYSRISRSRV